MIHGAGPRGFRAGSVLLGPGGLLASSALCLPVLLFYRRAPYCLEHPFRGLYFLIIHVIEMIVHAVWPSFYGSISLQAR